MKKQSNSNSNPNSSIRPESKAGRRAVLARRLLTFRFMLIAFFMVVMAASGFVTGMIFVLGYLARFQPIHGLPITTLISTPVIISVLLSFVIITIWSGRFFRPLKRLTEATKKVGKGDFSVRIPEEKGNGEMSHLVRNFNLMVQELDSNELFRKDFINNFSHEFKTPIVSIRGFARQLKNEDLTEEQRAEYIDIIIAESDRLAGMSTNVLLLTKLENQTIVTDKAPFYLDEQIRSELLLMEDAWTRKNLCLSPELEEIEYNGSAELLSHVWRNLLSNAIKFSPDGGELKIDLFRAAGEIVVKITDEGPGMDEATAARIFDKFYQGDTSHKTEGNGLGLSIAARAVTLCGGVISVQSAPSQGTTFTVRLPG
ncbi:MAG: HAMP domain-containing histidine kinase [Clostridia bacterium]|nr:HAMP domain-containing histidine kinase [Clostridia bacterium]